MHTLTDSLGVKHIVYACPFCGSEDLFLFEPRLVRTYVPGEPTRPEKPAEVNVNPGFISCNGCGSAGPSADSTLATIDAWNDRHIPIHLIREN